MTDEYLYHHGVKGMKWGVRRYRNKDGSLKTNKNSKRQVKKISKAAWDPKGNFTNRSKLLSKMEKETKSSKEGKAYKKLIDTRGIKVTDKKGNTSIRLSYLKDDWSNPDKVLDQMVKDKNIESAYNKKAKEIGKKYADQYAGAALKDLGFTDTKAGRDYLRKNKIFS